MRIVPPSPEGLQEALTVLRNGGVIAHATETCYGLACDLSNIAAVEKLFAIKQRPPQQPVSALFASVDQAKQYVVWNEKADELAAQYLPGPLTIILPMRSDAPCVLYPFITSNEQRATTIGVRVSSSTLAHSLVSQFGQPISTTSANLHGLPNPYSPEDIVGQFATSEHQPDLILDSGVLPQNPPSTVVDCTGETLEKKRSGDLRV